MAARFTLEERERVLEEAIRLIQEPANWITGSWKCDLYQVDEKGYPILDENGMQQPVCDKFNRPQAQYCIEGAVNQAIYNILGEERAIKLGAYSEENGVQAEGEDASFWPTDTLGIDDLARKKYPDICEDEEHAALVLNDYHEPDSPTGHKRVLGLLRDSLAQIRAKRGGVAAGV